MSFALEIKKQFINLSYDNKIELLNFVKSNIAKDDTEKLSLKDAAERMKFFYETDSELTAFQSIEGEIHE